MQRIAQIGAAAARRIFQNRHQQRGDGDRIRIVSCGTEQRRKAGIAAQLRHAPSSGFSRPWLSSAPAGSVAVLPRRGGGRAVHPANAVARAVVQPTAGDQPQRGEIAAEDLRFTLRRRTRGLLLRQ